MDPKLYNQCLITFLNWRYETANRLARMAMVPLDVANAVLYSYYKDHE